jgi:hypothetical protein
MALRSDADVALADLPLGRRPSVRISVEVAPDAPDSRDTRSVERLCERFGRRLSLAPGVLPVRHITFFVRRDVVEIVFDMRVAHRDTGIDVPFRTAGVLVLPLLLSAEDKDLADRLLLDMVRRTLRNAMLHEVDEAIGFDGARPFDPHRTKRPP